MATIFLSHRRDEQADADALRRDLHDAVRIVSHTVSPAAEATWRDECLRLIESAGAVVCIVGDRTAESVNVDWELETAYGLNRPVLAVRSASAAAPRLPGPIAARGSRLLEPAELRAHLSEPAYERTG